MKKIILFLFILIATATGCKKNNLHSSPPSSTIEEAHKYFTDSILLRQTNSVTTSLSTSVRPNPAKTVIWDQAETRMIGNYIVVIAPVVFSNPILVTNTLNRKTSYNLNDLTKLILYRNNSNKYKTAVVSYFPDSNFSQKSANIFSGLISADSWYGEAIDKYRVTSDGKTKKYDSKHLFAPGNTSSTVTNAANPTQIESVIQVCYEFEEWNYSEADPIGYHFTVPLGCSTYYVDESFAPSNPGSLSGANLSSLLGGGGLRPLSYPRLFNGNNNIGNIKDYDKCFDNIAGGGYSYQVTVCVDQPDPGTREAWGLSAAATAGSSAGSNPVDVGHTFLIFKEISPSKTIIRNVGFYPSSGVNPYSPSSQGVLNDDEGHAYDISLTISLTSSQFSGMLNYVSQGNNAGFTYNLSSNNCTTFALAALAAGQVNIVSKKGSWLNGSGNDPGDLGEDIRSMSLSPNMTRSTTESSHPNTGTCF